MKPGPEIYQSIGVEPIINCRGTFTIIGGSVELPEVRAAMDAASRYFVQIDELADAVGQRLAELTGAEWGMVSSGCAAGLKHVTAACVTGGNPEKLVRIPNLAGFDKTEVIVPRYSRNVYDAALHNIGVTIITVDTPEELADAISPTHRDDLPDGRRRLRVRSAVARGHRQDREAKNIPILIDAAAEILTIPNVHLQRGATVVAYSGGKAIRGPQCAGLLLGRKDILMSAWQASAPHHGPGRDNKVGREETLGMLAAVEAWVKRDHQAEWKTWLSWLNTVVDASPDDRRRQGGGTRAIPVCRIGPRRSSSRWDPARFHVTGEELAEELAKTKPRIALGAGGGGGQSGHDLGVGHRLDDAAGRRQGRRRTAARGALATREPRSTTVAAPAANIAGQWEVDIEFYSGKSRHVAPRASGRQLARRIAPGRFHVT